MFRGDRNWGCSEATPIPHNLHLMSELFWNASGTVLTEVCKDKQTLSDISHELEIRRNTHKVLSGPI